jgi:hypothetical protein
VLLTILPPAPAAASGEDPAVDQYVERVPTAGGDGAPVDERRPGRAELPARIKRRLESAGGEDAVALEAVAASPALGARPASDLRARPARGPRPKREPPSALRAAARAPLHADAGTIALLLAGLALVTIAVGAAALRSRRAGAR